MSEWHIHQSNPIELNQQALVYVLVLADASFGAAPMRRRLPRRVFLCGFSGAGLGFLRKRESGLGLRLRFLPVSGSYSLGRMMPCSSLRASRCVTRNRQRCIIVVVVVGGMGR